MKLLYGFKTSPGPRIFFREGTPLSFPKRACRDPTSTLTVSVYLAGSNTWSLAALQDDKIKNCQFDIAATIEILNNPSLVYVICFRPCGHHVTKGCNWTLCFTSTVLHDINVLCIMWRSYPRFYSRCWMYHGDYG